MSNEKTITQSGLVIHGKRNVVTKTVNLRKDQIELLKTISKFQGISISKVVTNLLKDEMNKDDIQRKTKQVDLIDTN